MRRLLPVFLFALIGCAESPAPAKVTVEFDKEKPNEGKAPEAEVKLTKVNAAEFEKIIASHKGKVVAIDVWADFCAPCKKAFPHIVKLHNQKAKDGLVCISLSKDQEVDEYDGALMFLKAQKATLANYILWDTEEAKDDLEKRIGHIRIPVFHVFDKNGKLFKTWEGSMKHDEIDTVIEGLLKNN